MEFQGINFATFDDLPTEVRVQIWRHIDRTELQVMRRVSKIWNQEIQTHFGISILISQESWPHWHRVQVTPGITHVHFHSFTARFTPSIFTAQLRSISFSQILLKNNLICILQHFGNIEELYFSKVILDQDSQIYSPYPINLPNLRSLEIHAALDPEGDLSVHDAIILCFMGQATFGVLETFRFSCPNLILSRFHLNYLFNGSLGKSDWLVELVDKNRHTLRKLILGSEINSFVFTLRERMEESKSTDNTPIQMEAIQASDTFPKSWGLLIRTQYGLQRLELESNGFEQWDAAYNAIRQSEGSIEAVSMSGSGGEFTAIDLNCFTNCNRLIGLQLHFQVYRIDNIQYLPVSLQVLSLYGPLSKFQISTLIGNLVNLQAFNLDNQETVDYTNSGFTNNSLSVDQHFLASTIDARLLRHFVLMPKLEFLVLKNCTMNFQAVKSWFQNQSSFECIMKVDMKPLNEAGTLGSIRAEIELESKRRLSSLDPLQRNESRTTL